MCFWLSFRILNTTLFESWELIGPYPSWWLFNGLLVTLQVLHVIWSYLIIRTASKALVRGKVSLREASGSSFLQAPLRNCEKLSFSMRLVLVLKGFASRVQKMMVFTLIALHL